MTRDDPVPTTPGMVEVLQKAYDTFKPPSVPSGIDKPLPYPAPDMRMKRPRQGDKIPSTAAKRAGIISRESREATDADVREQRIGTPLKPHASPREAGRLTGDTRSKAARAQAKVKRKVEAKKVKAAKVAEALAKARAAK